MTSTSDIRNNSRVLCRLFMSESYETKDMAEVNGQIEIPSYVTFMLPSQKDDLVSRLFDLSLSGWHVDRIGAVRESWDYNILEIRLYRSNDMTTNIDADMVQRILKLIGKVESAWMT